MCLCKQPYEVMRDKIVTKMVYPYLTLPTGKACYRLALRPPVGPMRIPELTLGLQEPLGSY